MAIGHPKAAADSYKKTLNITDFEEDSNFDRHLHPDTGGFTLYSVEELIPSEVESAR